jgi:hypothetical protein
MPHEFIDHAQECLRWADNTADPERKAIFTLMASTLVMAALHASPCTQAAGPPQKPREDGRASQTLPRSYRSQRIVPAGD